MLEKELERLEELQEKETYTEEEAKELFKLAGKIKDPIERAYATESPKLLDYLYLL